MCYRHATVLATCPECGATQSLDAFTCTECGADLPDYDLEELCEDCEDDEEDEADSRQ